MTSYSQDYPWNYEHFSKKEMECKCGCGMLPRQELMWTLKDLRQFYGRKIVVSSGARCEKHDSEIGGKGEHALGQAADILVFGSEAFLLLKAIFTYNHSYLSKENGTQINRIGFGQKGDLIKRFIHIGISNDISLPNPTIWSY